jgi:CheY-like chemotaxis protein
MVTNAILLLLAEDEPLILLSTQEALETGGFIVLPASNGAEAISAIDLRFEDLSGLITDVRLGSGPDGWEVARHARELKPDLAVVYTTGDSAADWSAQGVPKSKVIQKPYAPAQVLTAISTLLVEADTNRAG